jgi:hypothetical protein
MQLNVFTENVIFVLYNLELLHSFFILKIDIKVTNNFVNMFPIHLDTKI